MHQSHPLSGPHGRSRRRQDFRATHRAGGSHSHGRARQRRAHGRERGRSATRGAGKRPARRRHVRGGGEMRVPLLLVDAAAISSGDTAWVLASTALVMLMTVGLAFFYGGLVRPQNSLNTMMMSGCALGGVGGDGGLGGYSGA